MDDIKPNELVICKIEKIHPYGVTVSLEEFDSQKGFVPLSQVANRWVKNIRNFVRLGQIKVGKVMSVNRKRGQVDISFARVSISEEKRKMQEWRETKRAQQLIGRLANELNEDFDNLWDQIVPVLLEHYNSFSEAFFDILDDKSKLELIPSQYREKFFETLKKSITVKKKELSINLQIHSESGDALIKIKELFKNAPSNDSISVKASYLGGGKYRVVFEGKSYKELERFIEKYKEYMLKSKDPVVKLER